MTRVAKTYGVWVEVLVRVEAENVEDAEEAAIAVATGRNPGVGDVEEANIMLWDERGQA